ncbi:MAG: thiamine-phosphate kinase [Gemmatimonadales bacterium]
MTIRLGKGKEFDHIRAIAAALGPRAPELGNDCALVPWEGGRTLALTTDVSVERVHFRREWLTLEEIGWRAVAGSLSDLAAAAAEPIGVLVALTMPPGEPESAFVSLMSGAGDAAASVDAVLLGGDLSRGESISIAVTCVGSTTRPMRRSGARPGDGLWVTGTLGGARAALAAWAAGGEPPSTVRARFAHPEPRITAGRWLAEQGATAMLDLSDGLAGDAGHLAAASRVRVRVALERIPCHSGVIPAARAAQEPAPVFAAKGGEDYELLAALPASFAGGAPLGITLTRIGQVEEGPPGEVILELESRSVALASYDHFA